MKKRWCRAFIVMVFLVLLVPGKYTLSLEESSSQKRSTVYCQEAADRYSLMFGCDFKIATKEIEHKIKGVWQIKECVGYDRLNEEHDYSPVIGKIYIFCEDAWIDDFPKFQPVYYCYSDSMRKLSSDDILNIEWKDRRYTNKKGILIIAVNPEGYRYIDYENRDVPKLILVGNEPIVQEFDAYFRLEKVAELETKEDFFDVKH